MQLDYGRVNDLDELMKAYVNEPSFYWKKRIEESMDVIMRETKTSRRLRDELIGATRANDKRRIEYCRQELRLLQANRYNNNIQL